jgi:hypothetical protein
MKLIIKIILGICIYFLCINLITKIMTYYICKDLDKIIDNEIRKQASELIKKEIIEQLK